MQSAHKHTIIFLTILLWSFVSVRASDECCGKDLDQMHGLLWYDYGARQYDPQLCRWTSQDALAEKYYNVSPYNYCVGNPIMFVDPDGNSIDWVEGKEGSVYWDENAIVLS